MAEDFYLFNKEDVNDAIKDKSCGLAYGTISDKRNMTYENTFNIFTAIHH